MTRDNEHPAEKQSEISPSSEILRTPLPPETSPCPVSASPPAHGLQKQDITPVSHSPQDSGCT